MGKFENNPKYPKHIQFKHNDFILNHYDIEYIEKEIYGKDLNLTTVCNMLESVDLDSRLYALELLKGCRQLYNYSKSRIKDLAQVSSITYFDYKSNCWGSKGVEVPRSTQMRRVIEALREYDKCKNELINVTTSELS